MGTFSRSTGRSTELPPCARCARRSTGPVNRSPATAGGRPGRSTARSSRCRSTGPVDRRAQRAQGWSSVDRLVDRLKVPNYLLGTRSTARSTGGRGRSTARSTDKQVRAVFADLETCLYKYGISRVLLYVGKFGALLRLEVLQVL